MPTLFGSTLVRAVALYLVGAACGGLFGVVTTSKYFDGVIDKQKIEAANALVAETEKVLAAERKQKELTNELEKQHNEASKEIAAQHSDNLRLAYELKRLREQRRRESSASAVSGDGSATASTSNEAETSEVSGTSEDLLVELSFDADEVAAYAQTCYDWIQSRGKK